MSTYSRGVGLIPTPSKVFKKVLVVSSRFGHVIYLGVFGFD